MNPPADDEPRSILSSLQGPDPAALLELVPALPEALLPRALEIALDVRYPAMDLRRHLVEVIAERLVTASPEVLRQALEVARANLLRTEEGSVAAIVMPLVQVVPDDLLPVLLQLANHVPRWQERIPAFAALSTRLPPADAQAVLGKALERDAGHTEESLRGVLIMPLFPYLDEVLSLRALEIVLQIKQVDIRVDLLAALAPSLPTTKRREALDLALDTVLDISDPSTRANALAGLAPSLSEPDLLEKAIEASGHFRDKTLAVQAGVSLVGQLPVGVRAEQARSLAGLAGKIPSTEEAVAALVQVIPLLSGDDLQAAIAHLLELVGELRTGAAVAPSPAADWYIAAQRAWRLAGLAELLPPESRTEILQSALEDLATVDDPAWVKEMQDWIASLGPEPPQISLEDKTSPAEREANEILSQLRDNPYLAGKLVSLLPSIPGEKRNPLLSQALVTLKRVQDTYALTDALEQIAPALDETHLEAALGLANKLTGSGYYLRVLISLAVRFPNKGQPPLAEQALAQVEAVQEPVTSAYRLADLAPALSPEQLSGALNQALERARHLDNPEDQAGILEALAAQFPTEILHEAFFLALDIGSMTYQAAALTSLAPYVPVEFRPSALDSVLDAILAIGEQGARYLEDLALIWPPGILRRAVESAREYNDNLVRADTLSVLLAEQAAFASGDERWALLHQALDEALLAAVPRGGGKAGRSDPEIGSPLGERLNQLLQGFSDDDRKALLEGWLGPISPQAQREADPYNPARRPTLLAEPPLSSAPPEEMSRIDLRIRLPGQEAEAAPPGEAEPVEPSAAEEYSAGPPPAPVAPQAPHARAAPTSGAEPPEPSAPEEYEAAPPPEQIPPRAPQAEAAPAAAVVPSASPQPEQEVVVGGVIGAYKDVVAGAKIASSVKPSQPVVNTGFAMGEPPARRMGKQRTLTPGGRYFFWLDLGALSPFSIETTPSRLPVVAETKPVPLHVVLYAFPGEIGITPGANIGTLELQIDGSARVLRQPGGLVAPVGDPGILDKRLYFPVQAPDKEGITRLRCHIYYQQILIQARLIEAEVHRSPELMEGALQSKLDYTLAEILRPEHLSRMEPHRLSLMLNDNGDASHTLRFFAANGGEPKDYDARLLPTELEIPMLNARKSLWKVSWGDDNPWDPEQFPAQTYLYANTAFDFDRLERDLINLAVSGYILYDAIIDKLSGGRKASDDLADLMRAPGLVQIALRQSPSQVLPAALFYDYNLKTQGSHSLCETFKAALREHTPLENTPCFQGVCPTLALKPPVSIVCPSGFWGFRHRLGLPFSAAPGANLPPEIVVHGSPQMVVGIATNLAGVEDHLRAIQGIRTDMGWHETEHTDAMLDNLKNDNPHLVYFYCHGGTKKDVPFLQMGNGDEYIESSNLRAMHIYWEDPQPLIFINGCHTTALDPRQVINLVQSFIATGGAGVLGTEITVFENLACEFAQAFLESFLKTHASTTIGEAVRSARLRLLEKGNPLGLAYTPFVLPSVHLQE